MEIKIFENSNFGTIRTIEINGEVWFVGKDVAGILGYADTFGALKKHVDEEDKQNCQSNSFESPRGLTIINESGLYSLVLSSKLSTAKQFKRWVTSEVLPAIRKHGAYMTPQTLGEALKNPDTLIEILQRLKAEQEKSALLEITVQAQSQTIAEMKPKASYYDVVLNCKDLLSVTQIAKDYGKSAVWLNDFYIKNTFSLSRENAGSCIRNTLSRAIPAQRPKPSTLQTALCIRRCICTGRRKVDFSCTTC